MLTLHAKINVTPCNTIMNYIICAFEFNIFIDIIVISNKQMVVNLLNMKFSIFIKFYDIKYFNEDNLFSKVLIANYN